MKAILEEYGMIIVTVALALIFLLFATPFGNALTANLTAIINDFLTKANAGLTIDPGATGAALSALIM